VESAGCPLPCPLLCLMLVGSGEASVLGAFSFHLFLLYFFILLFFYERWHFGGKGNVDGRLEYSFKNDGMIEVCR
jgi:hypothetical protein